MKQRCMKQVMLACVALGLLWQGPVVCLAGIATSGLIQDLDADKGVTLAGTDVLAWANQAPNGGDDVATNLGSPQLVPGPEGRSAIYIADNVRMAGTDASAFDGIMQGSGHTWFAMVKPDIQNNANKNAVFGTLLGQAPWTGVVCHVGGTAAPVVARYMPRPAGDNWAIGTTDLLDGQWHIIAGRMGEGVGEVTAELFVDDTAVVEASVSVTIPGDSDSGALTVGGERTLGGEDYDGAVARILIYDRPLSDAELSRTMSAIWTGAGGAEAFDPSPEDEAADVLRDADLSWLPGETAATHNVYFGTSFDDVNSASVGNPLDALISQNQSETTLDPGRLSFGQTYYWRVDEVNGAPDNTVFKGEVWSFTAEPDSIPVSSIVATASSSHQTTMGPERTIDGSGLNELDQHSTEGTEMWLSGMGDPNPSIQYEFDRPYKLHEMWVWNSNQLIEGFVGLGAKDVTVEYSTDGADWLVLEGASPFAQAPGSPTYTANTTVDFGGVMAQYVKITVNAGFGILPQYGLSEVRFLYVPTFAREPQPEDGAVSAGANVDLSWRSGREAASHEVNLGTAADALELLTTVGESTATAAGLNYGTTYYWSITEVNDAEDPTAHAGDIWQFTTPAFGTVEDFEQYDDDCMRIFFAWKDGLGHNGGEDVDDCDEPPFNGNGGGSIVGHATSPFAEKFIVHSGTQSMPFEYDNAFGVSEASLSLAGQDWTASGVQTLSLMFYGAPGNTGQLYIKINNTKLLYDGEATNLGFAQWQAWNIDLSSVGASLTNVTSLTIGVDGASASGMLYLDSIRLYPQAGEFLTPVQPSDDGLLAYYPFAIGFGDSSGNGLDGAPVGTPVLGDDPIRGKVLILDGLSAVDLGTNEAFNFPGSFSISVWAKLGEFTDNWGHVIIGKRGENNLGWQLRRHQANPNLTFTLRGTSGPDDPRGNVDMSVLYDNWAHITAVYDVEAGARSVYVNGLVDTSVSDSGVVASAAHNTYIGARATSSNDGPQAYLTGSLDDLRVYNRALSPEEILWLAGRTAPVHAPFD